MRTARIAFSYDYQRVEAVVAEFIPQWRLMGFDAVVAIARGGLAPAVMAATALGISLFAVAYDRTQRTSSWFTAEKPRPGSRLLLVEDIAGRGTTLSDSIDFLRSQGYGLTTFTLAYDSESRVKPDYGREIPQGYGAWFPWERESITAAFDATLNLPDRPPHAYASWAIDLDGVLLPDLPEHHYLQALEQTLLRRDELPPTEVLPELDLPTMTIITGRPEQDRERTQAWLTRHGFHGPLVMRDASRYTPEQTALHKADAIVARCHTHFLESDAAQALLIANQVKVARILWWNGRETLAVTASQIDSLALA
jgi:hypoxanthine phosphoribosyltransferase